MKKRTMRVMGILLLAVMLSACGSKSQESEEALLDEPTDVITDYLETNGLLDDAEEEVVVDASDQYIDLTELSSTMVYSEVYDMMYEPEKYIGKTIKMSGMFMAYTNDDQSQYYPAVIIADATACCSQGIEFILKDNPPFPEGYPELETDVTVEGVFETYEEDGSIFCRLKNAEIL